MTIDIISLTSGQFTVLTTEQIEKIRKAQQKKNDLTEKYTEKKRKAKYDMAKAGNYRSAAYTKVCDELTAQCNAEIDEVREGLLFELQYTMRAGSDAEYADYALTPLERVNAVKAYYNTKYSDATERFEAFKADESAQAYLGEYYAGMYDYFKNA